MGEQPDKRKLFLKFLENECTAAELEEVLAYINAQQIPAEFEALMRENLEQKIAANEKVSPEISARLFQNIQASILLSDQETKSRKLPLQRNRIVVAASITCLLLAGLLYLYLPSIFSADQIYTTAYGETKQILLPDGSTVMLNTNSRLTVSSDWEAALQRNQAFDREVWLEGEAFFEVKKLSRPTRFLVHTNEVKVEVLGTKFNVNARQQKTRVVLDEGKVKLLAQNQPELVMSPGELVELGKDDVQFQKKKVNPETYISWRHNELVFEATPMTDIIDILKYNYGFEVTVHNETVNQEMLFTGRVPVDDIELLLKMLSESFNITILKKDKKIIFR